MAEKNDTRIAAEIDLLAEGLSGLIPDELDRIKREADQARAAEREAENRSNTRCGALEKFLRRKAHAILRGCAWGIELNCRSIISYGTPHPKWEPWCELSVFARHKTRHTHSPIVTVNLNPVRGKALLAQLRALRAALTTYTETMDTLMGSEAAL